MCCVPCCLVPGTGVAVAFVASLLRNLLGLGSLMAFPGSMCGALLCGIVYHKTKNLLATLCGEVFGTGIIGGLLAWPVAVFLMGKAAGDIAFYAYIVPFLDLHRRWFHHRRRGADRAGKEQHPQKNAGKPRPLKQVTP